MTIWYIDPSAMVNGSGTEESPFNTWGPTLGEAGDTFLWRRGTVFNTSGLELWKAQNWDCYGHGALPKIVGAAGDSASALRWNQPGSKLANMAICKLLPTTRRFALDLTSNTIGQDMGMDVDSCEVTGGFTAVRVSNQIKTVRIAGCAISGAGEDQVWCSSGDGLIIDGNTVVGTGMASPENSDGIQISNHSGTATIVRNKVVMGTGTNKQGIFVQSTVPGSSVIISDNEVVKPDTGGASIAVEGSGVVVGNIVFGKTLRGISVTANAENQIAVVVGNTIASDSGFGGSDYPILIAGDFFKTVIERGNTVVGNFASCITVS